MKNRMTTRSERPARQAISFLIYDVILISLACLSPTLWITLLCTLLSAVASIRAITLFSQVIFYRDDFREEEFVLRIGLPRH